MKEENFREKYRSSFKEFERSRYYLLIIPYDIESFAKYQTAWVLAHRREWLRKPCVLIFDKRVRLPKKIFTEINNYTKGTHIEIDMEKGETEILNKIKRNIEAIKRIYS